jgi:hypothetical protein
MIGHEHHVAGQHDLQAAAHGGAVDRGDDRLGEAPELGDAGEAARPEAALRIVVALAVEALGGDLLQVPAGREDALAGAAEDRDAQIRAVLERAQLGIDGPAEGMVDGVGRRPV